MLSFESLELLVATISGFVIAFIAEPIKDTFSYYRKRKRLKNAIYREIIYIYEQLFFHQNRFHKEGKLLSIHNLFHFDMEAYQAAKAEPLVFYDMPESSLIKSVYSSVAWYMEESKSNNIDSQIDAIENLMRQIEVTLRSSKFNRKQILEHSRGMPSGKRLRKNLSQKQKIKTQREMDR